MDEQERGDKLEELCGGVDEAWKLKHLWDSCRDSKYGPRPETKEQMFRRRAYDKGYSQQAIQFYIDM